MNKKHNLGNEAVYDARTLGLPRMLLLGLQHLFAMFGATVLVPIQGERGNTCFFCHATPPGSFYLFTFLPFYL